MVISPAIPPGTPRGYGGDFSLETSVTPAPAGGAFGFMTDFQINETSAEICGDLAGSEPIVKLLLQLQTLSTFQLQVFMLVFVMQ